MTENKGKRGEMVVSVIAASISYTEDGVDFIRPSVTNSADMGVDLFLQHPADFLEKKLLPVANGIYLPTPADAHEASETPVSKATTTLPQTTRVDVKTTDGKLGKGTVEKFIADTVKHPTCSGHILMGGSGLTKPAERTLIRAQKSYKPNNRTLAYVDNDGIGRLADHYPPPSPSTTLENSSENTAKNNHINKNDDP